jgi:hypothetical protein
MTVTWIFIFLISPSEAQSQHASSLKRYGATGPTPLCVGLRDRRQPRPSDLGPIKKIQITPSIAIQGRERVEWSAEVIRTGFGEGSDWLSPNDIPTAGVPVQCPSISSGPHGRMWVLERRLLTVGCHHIGPHCFFLCCSH